MYSHLTTEKYCIITKADIWIYTKAARSGGRAPLTAPRGHRVQTVPEWDEEGAGQVTEPADAIKWVQALRK